MAQTKKVIFAAKIKMANGEIETFHAKESNAENALYFLKVFANHTLKEKVVKAEVREVEVE